MNRSYIREIPEMSMEAIFTNKLQQLSLDAAILIIIV